jgi:hypothetical protein
LCKVYDTWVEFFATPEAHEEYQWVMRARKQETKNCLIDYMEQTLAPFSYTVLMCFAYIYVFTCDIKNMLIYSFSK